MLTKEKTEHFLMKFDETLMIDQICCVKLELDRLRDTRVLAVEVFCV